MIRKEIPWSAKKTLALFILFTNTRKNISKKQNTSAIPSRLRFQNLLFKTINGSINIITPDKKIIKEDDSINTRDPFGTFVEEEKE